MRESEWRDKDADALERLLVERWLYRGAMLAVTLVAAVVSTYLGIRGVTTWADWLTVGAAAAIGGAAAIIAFVMRLTDIRIHKELQRRRRRPGDPRGADAAR